MDDGRVNAMSPAMIAELGAALDDAERDAGPVVLTGRAGVFCGGFDLAVLRSGSLETLRMLRAGFELCARLLAFPYPVVVACNGHAVAMGTFLVLCADYRLGARGDYSLRANEVAIGLTLPHAAIAVLRQRLAPAHFERAALLAEPYGPDACVDAGFLDEVVDADQLIAAALSRAAQLAELDMVAHARSKTRVRRKTLRAIRHGLARDLGELTLVGARRVIGA